MNSQSSRVRRLGREQLDRRLNEARQIAPALRPPPQGWIGAIRTALGMTQADLAERMEISRQAVSQLEHREADGSITLNALREAAEALGGRVVYIVIPDRPVSQTLEERAYRLARQMVTSVRHTMRLEDQETDSDVEERIREIAEELLVSPRRLWSHPDGE
jgi:predicted DNA-binding mobile mystery protein A